MTTAAIIVVDDKLNGGFERSTGPDVNRPDDSLVPLSRILCDFNTSSC